MWKMAIFCSLVVLCGCSTASIEKQHKSDLHVQIGIGHLQNNNYPLAIREFSYAIEQDPDNSIAHNNLGIAYFLRKEYSLASEHLQKAIELRADYTEAHSNYGRVLLEQKKFTEAEKQFQFVLKDLTYPNPEKAYTNLGLVHLKMSQFTKAKSDFLRALEFNQNYCYAHNYYSVSLYELGEYENATRANEVALQSCKDNLEEGHYFAGLSFYKLGQVEQAREKMKEVIRLYPKSASASKATEFLNKYK